MENAKNMGDRYIKGLMRIKEQYPVIGDVRGEGLMLGIDFVKNPETK